MYKKNHKEEFSKWASSYDNFADIQKKVAKELLDKIDNNPKRILDLGCGTGEIYKNISWKYDFFLGVDCSNSMCELHPKSDKVDILYSDFDSIFLEKRLNTYAPFDMIISSSSLQWSKDIPQIFNLCNQLSQNMAFSIFTDGTFKTIYSMTNRSSFLPNAKTLAFTAKEILNAKVEIRTYKLYFEDNISKFGYIKKSGIGGGVQMLTYTQAKHLFKSYPLKYLEFEVLFIWKNSKK